MGVNKVALKTGEVLIDLSGDTTPKEKVLRGYKFHNNAGDKETGTCDFDMDTSEATATAAGILSGQKAGVRGELITGEMPNRGGVTGTISTKAGSYVIPEGYHDGSGRVSISSTEQEKIIASNIKSGVTILDVTGTYGGEAVTAQPVSITPSFEAQTILPPTGADYISQANVAAISVVYTDNSAGGKTVTIG